MHSAGFERNPYRCLSYLIQDSACGPCTMVSRQYSYLRAFLGYISADLITRGCSNIEWRLMGLAVPGGPFIGHMGSALEEVGFLYQRVTTGGDKRRQCGQQAAATRAL
jgi:hypothetical protein